MVRSKQNKLFDIFYLGLRCKNEELKVEIIDYIATEHMVDAISLLINYKDEEETYVIKAYIEEVIKYLGNARENLRRKIPFPKEKEDTSVIDKRDELILRWNCLFKELPKDD